MILIQYWIAVVTWAYPCLASILVMLQKLSINYYVYCSLWVAALCWSLSTVWI